MTSLALAFLAFFAIDVLWLSITPMANAILFTAQAFIWIAFLVDFGIRMYLTDRRWRYIATHPDRCADNRHSDIPPAPGSSGVHGIADSGGPQR